MIIQSLGSQAPKSSGAVYQEDAIDVVRIVLILALVFLHYGSVYGTSFSPFAGYQGQPSPVASILVSFVLFFAFTAVPMLAALSGWLFFRGSSVTAPPPFLRLWRKRMTSVVAPFVLWSAGAVAGAMALRIFAPELFTGELGEPGTVDLATIANAVLGVTKAPLAVQFWFVRDLIVTIALAPLIWLCAARMPLLSLALLIPAWLTDQTFGVFLRLDTFLFFWFGATLAIHRVDVTPNEKLALPLGAAFLLAVLARTLAPWLTGVTGSLWLDLGAALMRILGVAAVWSVSGMIARGAIGRLAKPWAPYAFLIYCAHYPLILYVKSVLGKLWGPESEAALVAHYFVTVALTLASIALLTRMLAALSPGLLGVLSGGRLGSGPAEIVVATSSPSRDRRMSGAS